MTTGRSLLTARVLHSATRPILREPQGMIGNPDFEAPARRITRPVGLIPLTRDSSAHERPICAAATSNAY